MSVKVIKVRAQLIVLLLAIGQIAEARNFRTNKEVFTRPSNDSGVQIILGIAELAGAVASGIYAMDTLSGRLETMKNGQPERAAAVLQAQKDVAEAQALMTYQERQKEIVAMNAEYAKLSQMAEMETTRNRIMADISELESRQVVTVAEKTAVLNKAKHTLNSIRLRNLQEGIRAGALSCVKKVVLVGDVILILDVFYRIYVLNSVDASPTFSPILTMSMATFFPEETAP